MQESAEKGTPQQYVGDYTERYREIIGLYEKSGASGLAVEAAFKIANYLVKHRRKILATEMLNEGFRVSKKLSDEEKVRVLASLASAFKGIGFSRKYSFFLGQLAQKFSEQSKESLSLAIFTKALKFYNIHSYESLCKSSHTLFREFFPPNLTPLAL